jgi:catechol 2,3-dioxygenase-like lactoylglutathione lyase family enzyme
MSGAARLTGVIVVADDVDGLCGLLAGVLGGRDGGFGEDGARCVGFEPGVTVEVTPSSTIHSDDDVWFDRGQGLHRVRFEVDDPEEVAARLETVGYRRANTTGRVVEHAPPGMGGGIELVPRTNGVVPGVPAPPGDDRSDRLVRRIDHVCAPSVDLPRSFEVFGGILGGAPVFGGDAPQLGVLTVQTRFDGGMKVEALQPVQPDTAVGNFAQRHPGRFHHLTMIVADVPEAERRLGEVGWDTIDTDLVSDPDWHETYLRPARTARVLLQLGATELSYTEPLDDQTMEQVFAGTIDATRYVMVSRQGP